MDSIKEFKLNNRYRVHRIKPEYVLGVKVSREHAQYWRLTEQINRTAQEILGNEWYLPQKGYGWGENNRWAYTLGHTGTFFFFRSTSDWEDVKLMYLLKFAGESVS